MIKNEKNKKLTTTPNGENYSNYNDFDYLTNGELVDINVNNIIWLKGTTDEILNLLNNLPDLTGYYTKTEVDNLLSTKVDNTQLDNYYTEDEVDLKLTDKVDNTFLFTNYYTKTEVDTELEDYYTKTEADEITNALDERVTTNETNIANNISDINTLNELVSQNFETFGRYNIVGQELNDIAGEVRFGIAEQIALNPDYIGVILDPNTFNNIVGGKVTFNIIADGITNDEAVDLTLTLRVYLNDIAVDTENKVIEASKTISVNYAKVLPVDAGDVAYATLQITDGSGSLTSLNPVVINIDFNSNGDISSVKSSQIINDATTLPNNGINPVIGAVKDLQVRKSLFNNSSGINPDTLINISEEYRNFSNLEFRISFNTYRLLLTLPAQRINIGDKFIIYNYTKQLLGALAYNVNIYLEMISNTTLYLRTDEADTNTIRIFNITGVGRI